MSESHLPPVNPVPIDVRALVRKSVATLYSHLVTRPTGRAVRLAIEAQLSDRSDVHEGPALSLVDLSEVTVLDFSCADEVVARLLARYRPPDRPRNAYFVFIGVNEMHREAIEAALTRHDLVAVAETAPDQFDLVGAVSPAARALWHRVEDARAVQLDDVSGFLREEAEEALLDELIERRLVVHLGPGHGLKALSVVARTLSNS